MYLVSVFAVILQSRRRLLSLMLLLISEASMVCVTLDVTAATTTTAAVMASVGVHRVVGLPSPNRGGESGRSGRLLLSSMVPIVTGEIPAQYCTAVGVTRLTPVPWTF